MLQPFGQQRCAWQIYHRKSQICKALQARTQRHWGMLKRAVRLTMLAPRLVWVWQHQKWPNFKRRMPCHEKEYQWVRSAFLLRSHLVSVSSTTQIPVSLSSGNLGVEWYGCVKAGSRLISLLARDWGCQFEGVLLTESAVAKGVAGRWGCGKIRHLEVPTLWFQGAIQRISSSVKEVTHADRPFFRASWVEEGRRATLHCTSHHCAKLIKISA
eukprot:931903-Amphidinium_carterae.1